jgi:hypothetical protein
MQPTLLAQPFHHKGWVYEEKVDGHRIVAHKDEGAVSIVSRQGKDHTHCPVPRASECAGLAPRSYIHSRRGSRRLRSGAYLTV